MSMASGKVWSSEDFPLVKEAHIREHLCKLGINKSTASDEMYPRIQRELVNVVWYTRWLCCH